MAKRPKLSKMEKLDLEIRNAYRKQARAMEFLKKGERWLKTSAADLARLHKARRRAEAQAAAPVEAEHPRIEKREAAVADALVEPPPVGDPVKLAEPISAFERHVGEPATMVKFKAPRKRKPKAEAEMPPPDFIKRQLDRSREAEASVEDRDARMKSFGFRKSKR